MKTKLKMYQRLWIIETSFYHHKLPSYIEEKGEKALEYREISPVYVCAFVNWWNGDVQAEICPVDFSDKKNEGQSWRWRRSVDDSELGKSIFLTKKEAENTYLKFPVELRSKWEEIKQLKRLSK